MDLESYAQDAAGRAMASGSPVSLGFLGPAEQEIVAGALSTVADIVVKRYGGYRGAVRKKTVVMPAYYIDEVYDPAVSFFAVRGGTAAAADNSDREAVEAFLRAMAIPREHVGDLFWTGREWQGVIDGQVFRRGQQQDGRGARGVSDLAQLDPAEVSYPGQTPKTVRAAVASMRLDAVAGAGFPASRTRLAQEIRVGRFRVNGLTVDSPAARIAQGDVIVCRGRGRLVVEEVAGATKRGRISLVLTRYSMHLPNPGEEGRNAYAT